MTSNPAISMNHNQSVRQEPSQRHSELFKIPNEKSADLEDSEIIMPRRLTGVDVTNPQLILINCQPMRKPINAAHSEDIHFGIVNVVQVLRHIINVSILKILLVKKAPPLTAKVSPLFFFLISTSHR